MIASLLLIPVLIIFTPAKPRRQRSLGLRIPLAVVVSWFAILECRMQFNLPALRELARQRDDYMYDGVGMNAALLVMGWIPPLIVTLIMIGVLQTVRAFRSRSHGDLDVRPDDDVIATSAENAT